MTTETFSAEETFELGKKTGMEASAGGIYCLDGDLGAGKTVFAKGFAAGLGVREPVVSPTFILLREYNDGRLPLYHFDAYRIADPSEMDFLGFDEYLFGNGVCLIEWAERISSLIPKGAVRIRIAKDVSGSFDHRYIEITR